MNSVTQREFFAECAQRGVSIYARKADAYGVRSFCDSFADYLRSEGVRVDVHAVTLLDLVRRLRVDRKRQAMSILSTWHGLFAVLNLSRSVFVLHGFPTRDHSLFRFLRVWIVSWLSSRLAHRILANSSLTQVINSRLFAIDSHVIWNPLRSRSVTLGSPDLSKRSKKMAFVGRAIRAKNAFEAAEVFLSCPGLVNWRMLIIGDLDDERLKLLALTQPRLECTGRISRQAVLEHLRDVRVFISVNPLEPYGFVYQEAALCGTIIVAPSLAGAVEDLRSIYPARLVLLKDVSRDSLAEALDKAARQAEDVGRLNSLATDVA